MIEEQIMVALYIFLKGAIVALSLLGASAAAFWWWRDFVDEVKGIDAGDPYRGDDG